MFRIITKRAAGATNVKTVDAAELDPAMLAGAWIAVEAPTASELDSLSEKFHVRRDNLGDVLDLNESPRLDHDARYGYLYVRYAHVHADGTTTTRPLLIIYNTTTVMTISAARFDPLDGLLADHSDLSTHAPQCAVLKLLESISTDYDTYIKKHTESIKKIITKMQHRKLENEDFVQFVLIEDRINAFLSALMPAVLLLRRLATSRHMTLSDGERDRLEDVALAVEQSIHICNANNKRIVSIREAYATLSNNSLNRTMKALTAATLFIALPNVVFGMYGMNIGLPIQDQPWAFAVIVGSTLLAVALIIFVAKRKRWF